MGNEGANEIQTHLGKTIAFQLIMLHPTKTIHDLKKATLSKFMTGATYESHGIGAYGHMLEYKFQAGNKLIYRQLAIGIESGEAKWLQTNGTWEVNSNDDSKLRAPIVIIKHPILTGPNAGKAKTNVYVIREDCYQNRCSFGLYPIYKARKDNGNSDSMYFKAFDQIMDECSA